LFEGGLPAVAVGAVRRRAATASIWEARLNME